MPEKNLWFDLLDFFSKLTQNTTFLHCDMAILVEFIFMRPLIFRRPLLRRETECEVHKLRILECLCKKHQFTACLIPSEKNLGS